MKNQFQISIPNPCHQNWHEMNVAEKGRFCSSCQKNVIDYTMQSDTSILKSFSENDNLCGRFLPNQLDRILLQRKEKSVYWQVGMASFLGFFGLGSHTSQAQGEVRVENKKDSLIKEKVESDVDEYFELKGIVVGKNESPIAGANVNSLKNRSSTQTDFNGNFTIIVAVNDQLVIQYLGMEKISYQVKRTDKLTLKVVHITLTESSTIGELVIVVEKKQTFMRKLTRPFRKLFKKKKCEIN